MVKWSSNKQEQILTCKSYDGALEMSATESRLPGGAEFTDVELSSHGARTVVPDAKS